MKQLLLTFALLLAFVTGACAQTAELDRVLKERAGQYQIDVIQSLLEQGLDTQNEYKRSPLMLAAKCGYTDLVKALIEAGADLNLQDTGGNTALIEVSADEQEGPNTEIAKILIEAGADVNLKNNHGETSLLYITHYHEPEIVQLLIDKGADLNPVSRFGDTPLSRATNNSEDVAEILRKAGAGNVDYLAGIKDTATEGVLRMLREKSYTVGLQAIVKLLEQGINAQDDEGRTPLILAVIDEGNDFDSRLPYGESEPEGYSAGNVPFVKELIAMGADVNLPDNQGATPLINAVMYNNKDVAEALLAAKAAINKADKDGTVPLVHAIRNRDMDLFRFLLDAGADIEIKDNYGSTVLYCAASDKNLPTAKCLLERGAKVNVKNDDGETTPLMNAGTPENIALLLQYKADINAVDEFGRTALIRFAQRDEADLVKALIEHKADLNVTDKKGRSALNHAREPEVRKILLDAGAK